MTRYVIGDIHGCGKALRGLLGALALSQADEIVFLGDYVDRGPDSRGVIDQLIALQDDVQVRLLRGNHEVMMQAVVQGGLDAATWLRSGGNTTVASYGGSIAKIPTRHVEFLQNLQRYHETPHEIFVHAMYDPEIAIDLQNDDLTYWTHLPTPPPAPHQSGKRVFVGHTPQANGEVLIYSHLVVMDTYCFGGGYLTAMDLDRGRIIQANRHGHVRRVPIEHFALACKRMFAWAAQFPKRRQPH